MRYWVIKGNPSEYDLDEEVQEGERDWWHTKKPPRDWKRGDRIFFWSSSPRRHLVALGRFEGLTDEIDEEGRSIYEVQYLTDPVPNKVSAAQLRADRICAGANFLKPAVAQGVLQLTLPEAHQMYRLMKAANPRHVTCWPDIKPIAPPGTVEADTTPRAASGKRAVTSVETRRQLKELVELDAKRTFVVRREQGLVRSLLLGGKSSGTCIICGNDLPADLLVAAHIKPRAMCSPEEQRDFEHNTALMCTLGCDALFERGYVSVVKGKVQAGPTPARKDGVRTAVQRVAGRVCPAYTERSSAYFRYRRDHAIE